MENKGFCPRYLQMTSQYLLFAVKTLELKDKKTELVSLDRIFNTGKDWEKRRLSNPKRKNLNKDVDTKMRGYVFTTFKWLSSISRINPLYLDNELIFNRFNKNAAYRLNYLHAPFLKERLNFLNHLEANGMSFNRIREYAVYQIHIISFFKLTSLRMFDKNELDNASEKWWHLDKTKNIEERKKRYKNFHAVSFSWFKYLGILTSEDASIPELEKFESYYKWAIINKGLSTETIKSRRLELKHFSYFLFNQGYDLKSLNIFCLDKYIELRHKEGCHRRSIGTVMTILRAFFHFAYNEKFIKIDLSFALKNPRLFSLETLPSAPKWEEVQKLVEFYNGNTPSNIRNKAIITLLSVYGIRCSELSNITIKDIDWENDTIIINRAKRCNPQVFPLPTIVGNALTRYITEGRRNDLNRKFLFLDSIAPFSQIKRSTIYGIVAYAYKSLNITLNHIGPHSLRHACASHLINSGHTLKEVSDLLGHKQLDTTRIYTKIDIMNLRKVADMNWEEIL
ncbi:MAG: tyrosine-type recombinase/integrase [Bacilli bacterium]